MNQLRAATYVRYSSDMQKASSLEDQLRNCQRRADAEGWEIVAQFADAEWSATDSQRTEYLAMQKAAKAGAFDVLIVDDLSRLSRDSLEQERLIRMLKFRKIRIVSLGDGYDSNAPSEKMIRMFVGMKNEVFIDDLAKKVHRGQEGQAIKGYWNGGRPYGYRLVPDTRINRHGEPEKIGTLLEIHPEQAAIVKEMFERFAAGESCGSLAGDLNARAVPSPGSSWNRVTRRCSGWMGSAVRVILKNPLYTGRQRWNFSEFEKDPDTGKQVRRKRPESEWQVTHHEHLRIVSDELFDRVQRHKAASKENQAMARGKATYVLSGALRCSVCKAHFVIADARSYACSSFVNGGKANCSNHERVRIDAVEREVLGPVRQALADPARRQRMVKFMEQEFARRVAAAAAGPAPKELQALDARIERLRGRLRDGDPDMTPDELKAVLDAAVAKRQALAQAQPEAKATAKILSMLPKAADTYLRQIDQGIGGDPRQVQRARHILRGLVGQVDMVPGQKGELFASYRLNPWAVLKGAGYGGRDEPVSGLPAEPVRVRVKG